MYDWTEVAAPLDRFWASVRERLLDARIDSPRVLFRGTRVREFWRDQEFVLDQVCALNPVREGSGVVVPLGTLHYLAPPGLPVCRPGDYYSVIVCRASDRRREEGVRAFRGARIAANATYSYSGYSGLGHHVRSLNSDGPFFGACVFTGGHRASIHAVAAGAVDLAAIDVHSWRLALDHEPDAERLVVIDTTAPTPGAACVTSPGFADDAEAIDAALATTAEELATTSVGRSLCIAGYVSRALGDFEVVAERAAVATRSPWHGGVRSGLQARG
jgi:hypothetical protein